jgi:parallel beta-helix repeat protein
MTKEKLTKIFSNKKLYGRFTMKKLNYFKYCSVLVSLILVCLEVRAQNGWTQKTDIPKGGGSASVVNNKIFVLGGSTAGGITDVAFNVVYDPSTDTWEEKAPMPTARGFLTSEVVNDTIYAIGGGYPTAKKTVEAYDPATDTWITKSDMPTVRLGMRAAVVDGIIYVIGGNYNQRNCYAYNPVDNEWTEKTPMPKGGGAISLAVYNGLIYAFGGATYPPWYGLPYTLVYNPQTDQWTEKKEMPTRRLAFITFLIDGKIYALGGAQYENQSLSTLEVYDPERDIWESKTNMPFKGAFLTGEVVNDKIYLTQGTPNWTTVNFNFWEFDPSFNTPIAAGDVSGTWTLANSPYHILGQITVPDGETLTIEPGVEVVFMGHHKFNVQGRLLAVGTQQDPILFTAENKTAGWHGIRFINTPATNDTSKIIHCSLKYGKANTGSGYDRSGGAIFIRGFDKVFVSDCLFEYNMTSGDVGSTGGPGVCIFYGSPTITNSTFIHNDGTLGSAGAIKVDFTSNAIISNNIISNNTSSWGAIICGYQSDNQPTISGNIISNNVATVAAGGILIYNSVKPRIENNIIIHNQAPIGGGIYCLTNANPVLLNNTIAYNSAGSGGGIYFDSNSDGIFINNILFGNTASSSGNQVFINDAASDPIFVYNDIQGGKEGFGGTGAGTNYTGLYENNIDADPLFMHPVSDNYRLSNYSPCIGAGIIVAEIAGVVYNAPPFCIMGNPRPNPVGSNPDIGAYENILGTPTDVEQELPVPKEFVLYQNYPNPFNPSTVINFEIPKQSNVLLKVYDILGNEIATLINEEKSPGNYQIIFDASALSNGVYLYRLQAGNFVETKKMILIK